MTTYQPPDPEEDPTALEPDEDEPGDEDIPEEAVLDPEAAAADDTVDDEEADEAG